MTHGVVLVTLQKRKPRRQRTDALHVQHSETAAVLSTSFLLNRVPKKPKLNALIRDLGSQREDES